MNHVQPTLGTSDFCVGRALRVPQGTSRVNGRRFPG